MMGPVLPRTARERLIVALDVPGPHEAVEMARRLDESVLWIKVGLELFCAAGPSVVEDLAHLGKRIFLDLKFHDIPNTVAGALRSVARLPIGLVDIHASAGSRAMEEAARIQSARGDLGVIAVTRLTSAEDGPADFSDVRNLAEAAARAGLFGVVCPAAAASDLRETYGDRLARVVPGIRPAGSASHDQIHVATPEGAVRSGAHWIVVGRAITQAADPAAEARRIIASLEV